MLKVMVLRLMSFIEREECEITGGRYHRERHKRSHAERERCGRLEEASATTGLFRCQSPQEKCSGSGSVDTTNDTIHCSQ